MATLKDIARLSGVSVPTVSRILNNKPLERPVRPETIKKVLATARRLRYVPHAAARNLARRATDAISFLLSSAIEEGYAHESFGQVFEGAQAECQRQGFKVMAGKLNVTRPDLDAIPREVTDQSAAGCLLAGYAAKSILDRFERLSVPFVVLSNFGSALAHRGFPTVATDRAAGVAETVEYLAGLGRRSLAYVTYRDPMVPPEGRDAFLAACRRLGLRGATGEDLTCSGEWEEGPELLPYGAG